ncbi:helix-turn-helix domain-containing protein, partial [Thermus sp. NMX2.A1]|uniref:helix-turn-helix domain-containing protein n=2 Tax=unclassified Thermus TaxID=2619321 RepID=UPI0012EC66EF
MRGAKLAFQLAEAQAGDPKVKERLRKLKQVETLRRHGVDWEEVQDLVGLSRATYHRWKRRLKEEGLKGLVPRSRRPKRLRRKRHWTPELLLKVEALRKEGFGVTQNLHLSIPLNPMQPGHLKRAAGFPSDDGCHAH